MEGKGEDVLGKTLYVDNDELSDLFGRTFKTGPWITLEVPRLAMLTGGRFLFWIKSACTEVPLLDLSEVR